MPINGLIPETKGTGLPRLGKFHKGTPKQVKTKPDGTTYEVVGRDTDYFRVEFSEGYEFLKPMFEEEYGKQPRSIPVKLNADTVGDVFDFWREEWDAAETLLHRCDGKEQVITYNRSTGYFEQNRHLCAAPSCKCTAVARLEVILPKFFELTGVLGTFTVETHSEQDMRTLYARLSSFQAMLGTLRGIPLHLYREKRETGAPKVSNGKRTGERMKVTRAMLDIQIDPEFVKENLIPALASTAFSTISPLFEKPTQHPLLVAAVHQGAQAKLMLNSGPKRIGVTETPKAEASTEIVALPSGKPSWWKNVTKTLGIDLTDEGRKELGEKIKALLDGESLSHTMTEKQAYDKIVEVLFKPAVQDIVDQSTLTPDEDAKRAADKEMAE